MANLTPLLRRALLSAFFLLICGISLSYDARALDKTGRLGVGLSTQLKNDFPSVTFKMQKSRSFAYGGMVGVSTDDQTGGYGVGLKLYRNIFDEPQLNFYLAGMGALLSNRIAGISYSGFQVDISFGSEFHLAGMNSLGFSFEFGASANKKKDFVFESLGSSFFVGAVHFYL